VPVGEEDVGPGWVRAAGGPGSLVDEPGVGARVVVDPDNVVVQRVAQPAARPVQALAETFEPGEQRVQAMTFETERREVRRIDETVGGRENGPLGVSDLQVAVAPDPLTATTTSSSIAVKPLRTVCRRMLFPSPERRLLARPASILGTYSAYLAPRMACRVCRVCAEYAVRE
jgi:hypothetical protein